MVNYQNPATIVQESVALVKLWHVVDGIFIWEFFTTLDFEWDVIRGRRPYRWTIWIYSLTRVTTLLSTILNMVGFDITTPINCQAWVHITGIFSYSSTAASSLLIVLRVIAIWNRAKIILAITMTIWLAEISVLIYGLTRVRSMWSHEANTCVVPNFRNAEPTVIGSLVTDLVLLLIMLLGLLRTRRNAGGAFRMGHFLWKQGLIWLLIATLIEVPPAVLIILNLNEPLDLIFQVPCMITVAIAATRMYRGLVNFALPDTSHQTPRETMPAVHSGPIPLNGMEVTVHTEYGQYEMPQVTTDLQGRYKAHEVSLNCDEESGLEK